MQLYSTKHTYVTQACVSATDTLQLGVGLQGHLHYVWNANLATWLHLGNKSLQDIIVRPAWAEVTRHIDNATVTYLSIDRQ